MRRTVLGILMSFVGASVVQGRQGWKAAPCPIPTRWTAGVTPENVWPEYPRPRLVRGAWQNLNGLWQYGAGTGSEEPPPIGKELAGRILVPFPVESALSGVGKHFERLWYRRVFEVPPEWLRDRDVGEPNFPRIPQRVLLHFGAVDWQTTVYINGKEVGSHRGGYDPFTFDITGALTGSGPQELVVGVYDPTDAGTQARGKQVRNPKGIFYTPSTGIWQTVWLEPAPGARIDHVDCTPDIDGGLVHIDVRGPGLPPVVPTADKTIESRLSVSVLRDGREVAHGTIPGVSINLNLPDAKLWTPEEPNLYDIRVKIVQFNNGAIGGFDEVRSSFAMRKVSIGKDDRGVNRLFLNNKPYFQVGLLDQGFWPDGLYTAPSDEAMRYDIEQTKALGFNLIRKHVKVEPERWYDWCDKLGVLVWQDMPSGDRSIGPNDPDIERSPESAAQYQGELGAMIDHLKQFPCIVMWVPFNEGWGQFDTARIAASVKSLDPTRLVDSATGWTDRGVGDVLDIHSYPGPDSPLAADPRTEEGRRQEPARAAVLGEFGGLGLAMPGHTWTKESWGYQGMADQGELTDRYVSLLERAYELKETRGLSAVVYTQTTDVETECNGLMTYDRAVVKMDAGKVLAANQGRFPKVATLVPCAATVVEEKRAGRPPHQDEERRAGRPPHQEVLWRYTAADPGGGGADWFKPGFDDAAWSTGPGGFGTQGTPGAIIGTKWEGADIWLRRGFELAEGGGALDPGALRLLVHHDEDAEVYLNGVLGAKLAGYTTGYVRAKISPEGAATLKPGKNLMAVHCHQTRGGQYIDVGIVEILP